MKNFYEIEELPNRSWQPKLEKPFSRRPVTLIGSEPEPLPTRRMPVPQETLSSPFRFDYTKLVDRIS